jgi:hypothetical protein
MRPHLGHEGRQTRSGFPRDNVNETLAEQISRQKHRWLKRVMFDRGTSSSAKCFAFLVVDYLNCVTLDCWPSQKVIADRFGWSIKTVHRVAVALERRGHLQIIRNTQSSYRYAPSFLPEDEDKSGAIMGQGCPPVSDKSVDESFLGILPIQSSPSEGERKKEGSLENANPRYDRRKRGFYETEVARLLGNDGFDVLERLSEHGDAIVERLCGAYAAGELGGRELIAARLAAEQLPRKRRLT